MRRYLAWKAFLAWFTPFHLAYVAWGMVCGLLAGVLVDSLLWSLALALGLIALGLVPVHLIEPLFGPAGRHRPERRHHG